MTAALTRFDLDFLVVTNPEIAAVARASATGRAAGR